MLRLPLHEAALIHCRHMRASGNRTPHPTCMRSAAMRPNRLGQVYHRAALLFEHPLCDSGLESPRPL